MTRMKPLSYKPKHGRPPKGTPEPPLPPEPVRVEKPLACVGCYLDKATGLVAGSPDCPRHGIVRTDPRLAQKGAAMGL